MAKLISKTYGDALFSLAVEENKIDEFIEEITGLLGILQQEEDFSKLMNHPRVSVDEKVALVDSIFTGRISKELVGFLTLVVTKGRYAEIQSILEYFLDSAKEFKGIGVATTDYQKMEMNYLIDESLIGGMQIRIKDRVVDSSIRTKIAKMQQNLMQIQL